VSRSVRDELNIGVWTIDMSLQDKRDFFKALGEATWILKDWIEEDDFRETCCHITDFYRLDTYGDIIRCSPYSCLTLKLTVTVQPMLKDPCKIPGPKSIGSKR
jgi:hypothetical protein